MRLRGVQRVPLGTALCGYMRGVGRGGLRSRRALPPERDRNGADACGQRSVTRTTRTTRPMPRPRAAQPMCTGGGRPRRAITSSAGHNTWPRNPGLGSSPNAGARRRRSARASRRASPRTALTQELGEEELEAQTDGGDALRAIQSRVDAGCAVHGCLGTVHCAARCCNRIPRKCPTNPGWRRAEIRG